MTDLLNGVLDELRRQRRIDLGGYRRGTLERRLAARVNRLGDGPDDYLRRLRDDPHEADALIDTIAVNTSEFFRDPAVFAVIEDEHVPALLSERQRRGRRTIRAWSAGCAAGEEPYSMAILLSDLLRDLRPVWQVSLFATDIDTSALDQARQATYVRAQLQQISLKRMDAYFEPTGDDTWRLDEPVRAMVQFSHDDLTSAARIAPRESVFGGFDWICCRNLLIYLEPELQADVLERIVRSLAPGGLLALGRCESLSGPAAGIMEAIDASRRIFRKPFP